MVVLGAGTMGHGIAQVAAAAGYRVTLHDVDREALDAGLGRIGKNLDEGVSLGKVSEEARSATLARIRTQPDLPSAVAECDLVIEAAPESMKLKSRLLRTVEESAPPKATLASNTSSLSISRLAGALERPQRFIGLHFFNPVHLMRLVEVVRGERTSEETLRGAIAFVEALGRQAVVVKDTPGFASSRLGVLLGLEAMRMVEEGVASARDIDKAMELGYRHPMGPLKLTDLVGLDIRLGIAEYLHETLKSEAFRPPDILRRMVAEGRLGKKSGRGFYDWAE